MYVLECDGLGNTNLMEDAGLPGLVSIPYFTPSLATNPKALAARAFALEYRRPILLPRVRRRRNLQPSR